MISSLALMSIHKAPVIPLSEICERYFGISYEEAMRRATKHELPVPTLRLTSSRKSPVMVTCEALGAYIDSAAEAGRALWERHNP
ncbi:MAG: pyocin activator PrtN family protein [Burkholderiales bacterium]